MSTSPQTNAARSWYVSPKRFPPGEPLPGRYEMSFGDYVGPSPQEMEEIRGPFEGCSKAAAAASQWREVEGRRSNLWLILVENDYVSHCNKYDTKAQQKEGV